MIGIRPIKFNVKLISEDDRSFNLTEEAASSIGVMLGQKMDSNAGITEYYYNGTGEYISYEDYWAAKRFEAQPFYQFGRFLRDCVEGIAKTMSKAWCEMKDYMSPSSDAIVAINQSIRKIKMEFYSRLDMIYGEIKEIDKQLFDALCRKDRSRARELDELAEEKYGQVIRSKDNYLESINRLIGLEAHSVHPGYYLEKPEWNYSRLDLDCLARVKNTIVQTRIISRLTIRSEICEKFMPGALPEELVEKIADSLNDQLTCVEMFKRETSNCTSFLTDELEQRVEERSLNSKKGRRLKH